MQMSDFYGTGFYDLLMEVVRSVASYCFKPVKELNSHLKSFKGRKIYDDMDLLMSLRCVIGLLENYRGNINDKIPAIMSMVIELICMEQRTCYFKKFLYQVISMLLWYNASAVLKLMVQSHPNNYQNILKEWQSNLLQYKKDFEKERMLWGVISVIGLPPNEVPEYLNHSGLIQSAVTLAKEICEDRNKEGQSTSEDDDGNVMKSEFNLTNWYDQMMALNNQGKLNTDNLSTDSDDSIYGEDDEEFEGCESFLYESP